MLERVKPRPKALILYVSCIDAMLGNDHSFQTEEIMARYPDVNCLVLKMCPITRYSGDLPLVALQHDMYQALPLETVPKEKTVAFIGANIAFDLECELIRLLTDNGYRALHIQASDDYEDYLAVRSASLNLGVMPFALSACKMLKERYGTPFLPFFLRYDFPSIKAALKAVSEALSLPLPDLDAMEEETKAFLRSCAEQIQGTALVIDSTATLFPDALRETLSSCGFNVRSVYADDVSRVSPDVDSGYIMVPKDRSYDENEPIIAIGMAAASFEGASRTVNLFYDNGEWGFYGLKKLGERIVQAYQNPRSAREIKRDERR